MLKIKMTIDPKDLKSIQDMPKEFHWGAEKGFKNAVIFAEGKAKQDFTKSRTSAGGLHVRTGHLRRSITSGTSGLSGWVSSNSIYSSTHEFGATIKAKNSKYLKFQIDGHWMSKKSVTIPQRPFIMPIFSVYNKNILDIISDGIIKEMKECQ